MASASKGRRKRALEAHTEQQPHKKICTTPTQGSRASLLKQAVASKDQVNQENTPKRQHHKLALPDVLFSERSLKACNVHGATPSKLKELVALLPAEHGLLLDTFGKLQQIVRLSKNRKQQCSFQNCQKPVESITGRQFTMKQLLQLKTVYPEALELERVTERRQEFPGSAGKMTQREAQIQTLIDMPLLKASATPAALQDYSQQLAKRLLDWNGISTQGMDGALPDSDCSMEFVNDENLPKARIIPEAALLEKGVSFEPLNEAPGPSTPATATPGQNPRSSAQKPPSGLRSKQAKAKRLTFGSPNEKPARPALAPVCENQPECWDLPSDAVEKDAELARQLRRQSLDGSIPVSLAALRAVNDTAEMQASLSSSEMEAARQHATNLACLPRTFDSIRAMFGPSGPSVIPKKQVLERLLGATGGTSQKSELEGHINFLIAQVPAFVSWANRPAQGEVLKIDRKQDMRLLRERVMCLATS